MARCAQYEGMADFLELWKQRRGLVPSSEACPSLMIGCVSPAPAVLTQVRLVDTVVCINRAAYTCTERSALDVVAETFIGRMYRVPCSGSRVTNADKRPAEILATALSRSGHFSAVEHGETEKASQRQ